MRWMAVLVGVGLAVMLSAGGVARAADLGPNVKVFDPSMPTSEIQAQVDAIAAQQVSNQFGTQRYALLFKPGSYGTADHPLIFQVGYYTEVAGLGASPRDVTIHGSVNVFNQCDDSGCLALNNFWRSLSNLTIDVTGNSGCRANTEFWAVSQASPMRRVNVNGNTTFMDYCTAGPQYASGGYLGDSALNGSVVNGSQQQFYVRDSSLGGWSNGVWNQVFSGTIGAPPQSFPSPPYTTLATTPASRERPFLYQGDDGLRVFVPTARTDSAGTTWQAGPTAGRSLALSDFFVAHPSDSVQEINAQLARGRDLLFTPGVYDVSRSIRVKRPDTVVLGLGVATLTARDGAVPIVVSDARGVDVAGLMIDAGPVESPALLQVDGKPGNRSASQPTAIQDVFFRIGGPHPGRARTSLVVDADDVILDDIWAWRADHGAGVGWTSNTADTGVVVNGDDVTATGLFVEHYQRNEVIWNGERGRTVFFQNEMPYDAPDQAAWQHDGILGYAAYKVGDGVRNHEGWGMGSYIFTNVDPTLHASHAFEVPVRPGVRFHDLLTVSLNHAGTIDHVINDTGAPVTPDIQGPSNVVSYP
ncbi:MAG TPA: coagulation factor 5/8 type domain-containing protein [Solirubrobacteraceae bacterium]|nr:coagulation factor 5/8 type domain-containing protein [Solirubrobacteraceae bacterium]